MYEIRVFFSINTDRNFTKNHIYLYFPCGGYMLNNDKMGWINKFIDNWYDNSDSNEFDYQNGPSNYKLYKIIQNTKNRSNVSSN